MKKILLLCVVISLILTGACSSSKRANIVSLGLTTSDLAGEWVADSYCEWTGGKCCYTKKVTWIITDSTLIERICIATFDADNKCVEAVCGEVYSYSYDSKRNVILCNDIAYQIQTFAFLDIYKEYEMVLLFDQNNDKGSSGTLKFHRPNESADVVSRTI